MLLHGQQGETHSHSHRHSSGVGQHACGRTHTVVAGQRGYMQLRVTESGRQGMAEQRRTKRAAMLDTLLTQ